MKTYRIRNIFVFLFLLSTVVPACAKNPAFLFLYEKNLSAAARESVMDAAKLSGAACMQANPKNAVEQQKNALYVVRVRKIPALFLRSLLKRYEKKKEKASESELSRANVTFSIQTKDENGQRIYVVGAGSDEGIIYGVYRFTEMLGIRFFHPEKTYVPETLEAPDIHEKIYVPSYGLRGYQQHTLHPIEMMYAVYYPSAEHEKYLKNYILWLARNGQNFLTFPLLENIEPRWKTWASYMKKITAYAKDRGVKMGPAVQIVPGMQKNAYFFLMGEKDWKEKVRKKLKLYFTIPWDFVTIDLGEFLDTEPAETVEWFNFIAQELKKKYHVKMDVKIHVGGKMKVNYQGEELLYYFLPKFASSDVGMMIHTVMFYDVFRPAHAYSHENFYEHRELLKEQIGKREVIYFPESAYWCTFDIDVPVWFSEYIYARWNDMHGLSPYKLDGHVTFTSGFEWMHFLTDYFAAKQTWDSKISLKELVDWYADIFGGAKDAVKNILLDSMELQNDVFITKNLSPFLSGEDSYDEAGWFGNVITHTPFVRFNRVLKMKEEKMKKFLADMETMDKFVSAYDGYLTTLRDERKNAGKNVLDWYDELYDSLEITKLRAQHTLTLYRGALALKDGKKNASEGKLKEAQDIKQLAEKVIRRREKMYRYPADMMTERNTNYTIYPFAYLHQAHTLCFWTRREEELKQNIAGDFNPFALPKCI